MSSPLPPLRADLIVEAVSPGGAQTAYDVSSPDLSVTRRINQQAYMALSLLDGRQDFSAWATTAVEVTPGLTPVQLHRLVADVAALGWFSSPPQLPLAPPGNPGPSLLQDLSLPPSPGQGYDTYAPTLPNHGLSDSHLPTEGAIDIDGDFDLSVEEPTQQLAPEDAVDAMFGLGAPVTSGTGSPAPVTAVHDRPPGLRSEPPNPGPYDRNAPTERWTAPPTPVPAAPGRPAPGRDLFQGGLPSLEGPPLGGPVSQEGSPFPASSSLFDPPAGGSAESPFGGGLFGAPAEPFGGPAAPVPPRPGAPPPPPPASSGADLVPYQGAGFGSTSGEGPPLGGPTSGEGTPVRDPSVSGPISGEGRPLYPGRGEAPRVRDDLVVSPSEQKGLLSVQVPGKPTPFQIYELEHRLLQLMDGTRSLDELAAAAGGVGHSSDRYQLAAFIRQMDAYGFLEETGPLPGVAEGAAVWSPVPGDPERADWPAEERRLFQLGLKHFRDGSPEKAESFFEALLEVNPDNPEAVAMLELMGREVPVRGGKGGKKPAGGRGRRTGLHRVGFAVFTLLAAVGIGMAVELPANVAEPSRVLKAGKQTVTSPRAGVVASVEVKPGQAVKAGAVLVRFEDPESAERALLEREVAAADQELAAVDGLSPERAKELKKSRAGLAKKVAGLEKKRAKLEKAAGKRGAKGRKAKKKLESLEPELTAARANLQQQEAQLAAWSRFDKGGSLDEARAALGQKRARLAQLQAAAAKPAVVKAPVDLTVAEGSPLPAVGQALAEGAPVIQYAGGEGFEVEIVVAEADIPVVVVGRPFSFRLVAFPDQTFAGRVTSVSDAVEVVEGQPVLKARGLLAGGPGGELLKPELSGWAEFEGEELPVTLIVVDRVRRWLKARFLL